MMEPRFALGTRVTTFGECFVIRSKEKGKWHIPMKGNYQMREISSCPPHLGVFQVMTSVTPIKFAPVIHLRPIKDDDNKSVGLLGTYGSGTIIGFEKKQIGKSVGGGGTSTFGDDFDPGYFIRRDEVGLYVVKTSLTSTPFYVHEDYIQLEAS